MYSCALYFKAGLLRYKRLQLPKICRGTEIVRMNSNNPRSSKHSPCHSVVSNAKDTSPEKKNGRHR